MLDRLQIAQYEIEAQQKLMETTLTSISDAIIVTDNQAIITFMNPVAEQLTEWNFQEAKGQRIENIFNIINEQTQENEESPAVKVLRHKRIIGTKYPTLLITRTKKTIPIENKAAPIQEANETKGVVLVIRNITERKHAERKRLRLETQLRQAQKMKAVGTFASGIAHDFNNLLVPIIGFVGLLQKKANPKTKEFDYLNKVSESDNRAKDLVTQILLFCRKTESKKAVVQLNSIVMEVATLLRTSIPKTILITQEIESDILPVLADSTQIHQILVNLCINASQAMPEGGGNND